jgi:Spy/CpxP family protein refolding chaperone
VHPYDRPFLTIQGDAMRKGAILTFALTTACVLALSAQGQPPGGDKGDKGPGKGFGKGGFGDKGPGGKGGFMRPMPGQIMPPFLAERLKLTDDQKKAVADLQKDVDAKLDKMLTDEQKAELKKMREGGFGPGGFRPDGGRGGDKGPPRGGDKGPPRGGDKGPPPKGGDKE